ncbi:MAG: hypothetical protein LBC20_16480 [Planctomycetaceae bacterium]|jgi:hypothetical protein|nr:hypothetical protein [Planctomycetaceae bacterium]
MSAHYHSQFSRCRCPLRNERHGLSTIVGLAVLAIVGSTIILLAQTTIREKHNNAWKRQIIQADILVDDWHRIAEKQQQNISVTVPASVLCGVADLRLTAVTENENIAANAEYAAEELPTAKHYSAQKRNSTPKQK